MDAITPDQFLAAFPAFRDTPPADIQRWIDNADPRLFDRDFWGAGYIWAIANVVAHYLTIEQRQKKATGVPAGDITDKMVGSVRVIRAPELVSKQFDDPFMATPFGREYLAEKRRRRIGAVVSGTFSP